MKVQNKKKKVGHKGKSSSLYMLFASQVTCTLKGCTGSAGEQYIYLILR